MSLNILIVDDSGVMRSMIKKTLKMAGVEATEIHEAPDGRQGLEVLGREQIDLVISDINMPVMDGEEMIRHMKEADAYSQIPIVVISTEGSETRIKRFTQAGVGFIRKPFSPEQVNEVLNTIL
jgi:two-component system, chemotaxis family, chemotaxis protein CheY